MTISLYGGLHLSTVWTSLTLMLVLVCPIMQILKQTASMFSMISRSSIWLYIQCCCNWNKNCGDWESIYKLIVAWMILNFFTIDVFNLVTNKMTLLYVDMATWKTILYAGIDIWKLHFPCEIDVLYYYVPELQPFTIFILEDGLSPWFSYFSTLGGVHKVTDCCFCPGISLLHVVCI